MTYKYFEVRREIYEKCSDKALKGTRSFNQIKKLFTKFVWVMFAVVAAAMIALVLLMIFIPEKPFYLIPAVVMFLASIILEFSGEKIYNSEERRREIEKGKEVYAQYIQELQTAFESCGINSPSKRKALKAECEASLEKQAKPYNIVSSNVYSMLIGIPLGALISAIMRENNDNAMIVQIIGLITLGLLVIGLIKVLKTVMYYSDGCFKDRHLLEALNELEYADLGSEAGKNC